MSVELYSLHRSLSVTNSSSSNKKIGTYDSLLIFYARLDTIKLWPCALLERPRYMYMSFWETNEMGWQAYIKRRVYQ